MPDTLNYKPTLSNAEKYLPYFYPALMPILTLFAFKIPYQSVEDAFRYWLFTGSLQLIELLVIRKAVYSTAYNKVIRWLIAALFCCVFSILYWFLEYNFWHFAEGIIHPQMRTAVMRSFWNILLLLALVESIKSFYERSKINADNIALQRENLKAQFNQLLLQINPHFLFNSLTTLQAMVRSKDARTEEFIIKLQEVYHQTLKKEKGMVTLQEELDFFKAYMYLMTLRQENSIFLDVAIAEESLSYQIPTFTLQLLAENCIKHNIVSKAKPLYIRVYQKDPKSLTVSNNYQPKQVKIESFGIGIENLKKRYALTGIEQGVIIKQDEKNYETTIKLI